MLECLFEDKKHTHTTAFEKLFNHTSFRSKFVLLHLLFLHSVCVCVYTMRGWYAFESLHRPNSNLKKSPFRDLHATISYWRRFSYTQTLFYAFACIQSAL